MGARDEYKYSGISCNISPDGQIVDGSVRPMQAAELEDLRGFFIDQKTPPVPAQEIRDALESVNWQALLAALEVLYGPAAVIDALACEWRRRNCP